MLDSPPMKTISFRGCEHRSFTLSFGDDCRLLGSACAVEMEQTEGPLRLVFCDGHLHSEAA